VAALGSAIRAGRFIFGACALGCFTCAHLHEQRLVGDAVKQHRGSKQVLDQTDLGCAQWEREPGSGAAWA
jgi:hypothetical protein